MRQRTGSRIEAPYLAPRRYVPKELQHAKVGNIDQGALACAHLIKRRFTATWRKYRTAIVVVDLDGTVYACLRPGTTIDFVMATYPELVCGRYTNDVDVGDLASDLESMRRAA